MAAKSTSSQDLRILFLAAEADPLVKVGGLGDVAGSLPRSLRALRPGSTGGRRLDVRLVLPYHAPIQQKKLDVTPVGSFTVPSSGREDTAEAFMLDLDGLPVYLIKGGAIPDEGPVYSPDMAMDGPKFIFFSLAALELARFLNWKPDIVHANDWHTATAVYALSLRRDDPFFAGTRTVLSVHNLPFMGKGAEPALARYGLPPAGDPRLPDWSREFPLVQGLLAADRIIAVSNNYAREILTSEFGCNLQDFLKTRQDTVIGIVNGLDMEAWDPSQDTLIAAQYTPQDLSAKAEDKAALQKEFNLPQEPRTPLISLVSRMDPQKGVDLAIEGLRLIDDVPWQAILLGSGNTELEEMARKLEKDLPDRVRTAITFHTPLSHRIYAGSDILMMPSRYEPCGLSQMIAMRYGTVPVARATGGLADTITDDQSGEGTGFLFKEAAPQAFSAALRRALSAYSDQKRWQKIQKRGMKQDFSWKQSALEYARVYQELKEEAQ